jgi:hypothetical protein
MYSYDAANSYPRARSYQWKDTIGPVEQRATNSNFWGYNQSYGLGYYEYFQLSEDIGAQPVPVLPALVTGCGQNRATVDDALLQRHIQDALDLIEFANGPATSEWGAKRAAMGHPAPFGLKRIAIGNEENLPDAYFGNFVKFEAAIKAKYPDVTVISNSGPDDTGSTFDTLWSLNKAHGTAMLDELRGAEAVHEQRRQPGRPEHRDRVGGAGQADHGRHRTLDVGHRCPFRRRDGDGRRRRAALRRRLLGRRVEVDATGRAWLVVGAERCLRPVRHQCAGHPRARG